MIKHIFTMLVLMTFTSCLLTENEEQKESNYSDNRSSSSIYYSSEKEEQKENGIQVGTYKASTKGRTIDGGIVWITSTLNLKSDNTYSMEMTMEYVIGGGEPHDFTENTSGNWSFEDGEFCKSMPEPEGVVCLDFCDNYCFATRNVTSTSFEFYEDFEKYIKRGAFTDFMNFNGYATMTKQ